MQLNNEQLLSAFYMPGTELSIEIQKTGQVAILFELIA